MNDTGNIKSTDKLREFFKQWPPFYYFIANVFGPVWFTGLGPSVFFKSYKREGKMVNLGSGPKKIGEGVINVDTFPYQDVDIVSDITKLPLESGSVSMVVCDNVLEHIPNAQDAVAEIFRILEVGGVAYISTPFLYPFHGSPNDYHRWTSQGLTVLCKDFTVREIGVRCGMMSGLSIWACYAFARLLSFGSDTAYWFWVNVALLIFFPVKFLDLVMNLFPGGLYTASVLYIVVEKQ